MSRARGVILDELARAQAGIVTRAELLGAGWSPTGLQRAITAGVLHPVATGVFRTAGSPWTLTASRHAALAAAGTGAALADRSAAELLGLLERRPAPHHIVIPHGRRSPVVPTSLAVVRRSRTLRPEEIIEVRGLATTSPARTLLDLAANRSPARLAEVIAAAIRLRQLQLGQLEDTLDLHPGARGRSRLRDALALLGSDGGDARAEVEIAAVAALLAAGLPRPEIAFRIHDRAGRLIGEVDLAYPAWRLALEIDGYRWHSTPEQKRSDEARQNQLTLAGWSVLRFSAAVVRHQPHLLTDAVAQALAPDRLR